MTIFPNPGNGNFQLSFDQDVTVEGSNITIFGMDGQTVYSKTINSRDELKINLILSQGLFFVKLVTSDGKKFMEKLMIQ